MQCISSSTSFILNQPNEVEKNKPGELRSRQVLQVAVFLLTHIPCGFLILFEEFYRNGNIWRSTHFDMASAAHPTCFSRDEIAFSCIDSLRNTNGKCLGRRTWNRHSFIKMKLWSGTCDSRIIQLTSSYRNCSQLKSRAYHLVVHGKKNIASEGDIHTGPQANKVDLPNAILVHVMSQWRQMQIMTVAGVLACAFFVIPSADATDALKTCSCLLKECRIELAKCIANPSCAANVACLQTCNNRPDETECQIKCGDLFENSVVDEFNECAVSRKKCVPTKSDVGEFPVPDPSALVKSFNIGDFNGKWYISSGLNPTFDAFDCQLHEFHTESNKLVGNLTWRIRTPDTGFFTRTATQKFVQDPMQPGILYNHDNEYLHYQDDWYILSSKLENKPDDYLFVYYRGKNDAWDGYGGAFVYTRSPVVPESIVPELERAAKSVGRDFNTFIRTDNTCGPEPPLVERLEKTVEEGERTIIREVEQIEGEVEKVENTELNLLQKLFKDGFNEIKKDEENFLKGLSEEEMEILNSLKMEANEVEKLFGQALPLRKLK